ncbi:MAG: rhodanese-like domain-containing protein [Pedobacter sp.]|nr:rhodanese-like domain-containing protein [Pedobacter sp.]
MLLDVCTAGEYQSGSLSRAKNMDVIASDFNNNVEKPDKSKTYYMYCRSGNRSGTAVDRLKKIGIKAFDLVGGIDSWHR